MPQSPSVSGCWGQGGSPLPVHLYVIRVRWLMTSKVTGFVFRTGYLTDTGRCALPPLREQGVTCASLGSHPPAFGLRPLLRSGVAAGLSAHLKADGDSLGVAGASKHREPYRLAALVGCSFSAGGGKPPPAQNRASGRSGSQRDRGIPQARLLRRGYARKPLMPVQSPSLQVGVG